MNFSEWTTTISVLIAACAFILSLYIKYRDERDANIRDWQRVIVYSLVEDSDEVSFKDLKSKYLQRVQQLVFIKLPKDKIQDDALRRILMELQKDSLIVKNERANYQLQMKVPVETWVLEQVRKKYHQDVLKPRILTIIERQSGQYTVEALVRKLQEENLDVSFDEIDEVIFELRGPSNIKKNKEGMLEFVPPYTEVPVVQAK